MFELLMEGALVVLIALAIALCLTYLLDEDR